MPFTKEQLDEIVRKVSTCLHLYTSGLVARVCLCPFLRAHLGLLLGMISGPLRCCLA